MAYERLTRFYGWGCEKGLWDSHQAAADFIGISQPQFSAVMRRAKKPGGSVADLITRATKVWGEEPPILNTEWYPERPPAPRVPSTAIITPQDTHAGAGE